MMLDTRNRRKRVEVLAPGGSMEGIRAAVNAGADAVYAGGRAFGARAYARNPEQDDLFEAIDYCHLHQAKLYLTVNTLLKEKELTQQLYEYLAPVCEHGVDAVLVQDFGVFHFLRREFPDLPLHASTQMTVTGADGVRLLKEMGAERVVLSRELSLEEIRSIRQSVDVELETFVHGALCYCYSGQCLMSSLIGGRSGNRGRCAQPCRLPYTLLGEGQLSRSSEPYLLSPKDICTLRILPDLIDAGIASLKIEGRMKSPEYAAGVTAMYRRYVDLYLEKGRGGYRVEAEDEKLLTQLFSRGPYSEGYYSHRNGRPMMVLREQKKEKGDTLRSSQEAVARIHDRYEEAPDIPIHGRARIHAGEEMTLQVSAAGRGVLECGDPECVTVRGAVPSAAQSRPADMAGVRKQLTKTGDSPFVFASLQIDLEDGLFIPLKELNSLRRTALDALQDKILARYRRVNAAGDREDEALQGEAHSPESACARSVCGENEADSRICHPSVTASVCTLSQLEEVLKTGSVRGVYLDLPVCSEDTIRRVQESGRKAYIMMPPVWRSDTVRFYEKTVHGSLDALADGFLLRSFDQIGYLRERIEQGRGQELIADAGLYTWNSEARMQLRELGITTDTLPYECTVHELSDRGCDGSECVIYGYQVLMISAQCLTKTTTGCSRRPGIRWLKDRKGVQFPVRNECGICTNYIYNSVPLELVTLKSETDRLGPGSVRYSFTIESADQTARILRGELPKNITRGHFRKGVE